jgi:hypothetical protein
LKVEAERKTHRTGADGLDTVRAWGRVSSFFRRLIKRNLQPEAQKEEDDETSG